MGHPLWQKNLADFLTALLKCNLQIITFICFKYAVWWILVNDGVMKLPTQSRQIAFPSLVCPLTLDKSFPLHSAPGSYWSALSQYTFASSRVHINEIRLYVVFCVWLLSKLFLRLLMYLEMGKRMDLSQKEDKWIVNTHTEWYSVSLVIRKILIKTTVRYHFSLTRRAEMKDWQCKCWQLELRYIAVWVQNGRATFKNRLAGRWFFFFLS